MLADKYLQALSTISRLALLLDQQLEPARGNQTDAYKAPSLPRSKPPCSMTWLDLKLTIETALRTTCRQVWADLPGKRVPPPSQLVPMCAWLTERADHLAGCMWADSEVWWQMQEGVEGTSAVEETINHARLLEETLDPPIKHPPARTAPELAILLGISPDRIRQWKARGKLEPVGRQGAANLYSVDQVKLLLQH
jgi:hypothetical protein